MADLFPIPLARQIEAVKRELAMRERVYSRLVHNGTMKQTTADHELAAMRAVLTTLEGLKP